MMNRYFRCFSDEAYEQARLSLDEVWGHPTFDGRTVTCVDPANVGPRDTQGHIMVAIRSRVCEWPEVAAMIGNLLGSGIGREITEDEYNASPRYPLGYPLPEPTPPESPSPVS